MFKTKSECPLMFCGLAEVWDRTSKPVLQRVYTPMPLQQGDEAHTVYYYQAVL
jgi:hypothetical protein